MKTLRFSAAVAAVAMALTLSACTQTAEEPPLPPSMAQPSGSPSPTAAPGEPAPTEEPAVEQPTEPLAPSTAVIPSSGVQSNGYPQYPLLESQALVGTGTVDEAPLAEPAPSQAVRVSPVQKVQAAGGAAPTPDYVLNLTYKLCMNVQMYQSQGLALNDAFTKAMADVPEWVGFAPGSEIATAYLDVAATSYSYVCVPLFDERARQDLENGVYRG